MAGKRRYAIGVIRLLLIGVCVLSVRPIDAGEKYKVLTVMSYDEPFGWVQEISKGIESVLADKCEIKYFYMDTKNHFAEGPQKAKEAFALYNEFRPDGVIVADDDAQAMFVGPYLKDKVETPVIFCGVNAEPKKYGYPASNVTGVLERLHMKETIALVQNLNPSLKTIAYMVKKSPIADLLFSQFTKEESEYSAALVEYLAPATLQEAKAMASRVKGKADILFVTTLQGIPDSSGKSCTELEAVPEVVKAFGGVVITDNVYNVKLGSMLCAVVKTGEEQGSSAADMFLKVMAGKKISEIPIIQNRYGRRMINVDVMKSLGIKPNPQVVRNVELVRSEK